MKLLLFFFKEDEEDEKDEYYENDENMKKLKNLKITNDKSYNSQRVKRSGGFWRFACGNDFLLLKNESVKQAEQFVQVITNILGKEQTLESWQTVFWTAGAIYCTGAAIYFFLVQVGVVWCGMV